MEEADEICNVIQLQQGQYPGSAQDDRAGAPTGLLIMCPSNGEDYHTALEKGLQEAKAMGAEAACFGDIDILDNREWEEERCRNVGLQPYFPLWQRDRAENVYEDICGENG